MNNASENAYPIEETELGLNFHNGLTKREAFAMAAMQGILANSEPNSWSEEQWYSNFSKQAVNHADA